MLDIKTISRTSAIIYADEISSKKTDTIKRKFIESVFVNNQNKKMTIAEIANAIESELGLKFSVLEIKPLVKDDSFFVELLNNSNEDISYNLIERRYRTLSNKTTDGIQIAIDCFICECGKEMNFSTDEFNTIINRYLYSLMNTNIEAYGHVLNTTRKKSSARIDSNEFEPNEIEAINSFLYWDNQEKNNALFQMISYCIEYAIVVNDSSESLLTKAIKNKVFYLDNSFLYRAIGINGDTRKQRTLSFLDKCKQSGQKLVVSKFTKREFMDTIDFHIKQLNSTTPFGRINPYSFKQYAKGEGVYQFYHKWRDGRLTYGFELFKAHIDAAYQSLIKRYNITEDYKVPFQEKEENSTIINYKDKIQQLKRRGSENLHLSDACNMYWIELLRAENNINVLDTKYYFVTSDQKLQQWDYNHSVNQPITLLPSQWMGLLLKYTSRSSDDFKSFVSFLALPSDKSTLEQDDLQLIMSGISEITEDFSKQEFILEKMVANSFNGIINGHTRNNAKMFAKEKLEEDYEQKLLEKEKEKNSIAELNEQIIAAIKEESNKLFQQLENDRKQEKLHTVTTQQESLLRRKIKAESKIDNYRSLLKTIVYGAEIVGLVTWIILIVKLGWDKMEMWTYFVGIPIAVIPNLWMAISGKSLNIIKFIEKSVEIYKVKKYEEYDVSELEINELNDLKRQLEQEL